MGLRFKTSTSNNMRTYFDGLISIRVLYCFSILIATLYGCSNSSVAITGNSGSPGEFTHRMILTEERLTGDTYEPVFTKDFILADVNLNPDNPRRFLNYSGDLSGRYVEALSSCSEKYSDKLDEIVKDILQFQQPDGHFGDPLLIFSEDLINKEHMPLLWGNGRLLAGLLEYYRKTGNNEVLDAAVKLGDFFTGCYKEVTPAVVRRLEGLGADGIICFTQYVEPLVMLSEITGDKKYAEVASQVYPVLPQRGTLHSHGYLTTLRGVLDLYEYDKNPVHFEFVNRAYDDLINSDDYTVYGSVKEYFGGKGERDEGCSTADFIRLSLHLYKLTGKLDYLEKAEFALFNSLYFNQFFTGDFGHHIINNSESTPGIMNAAWWCCTMSGLRAMQIIQNEFFVQNDGDRIKINLLLDTYYSDDNVSIDIKKGGIDNGHHIFEIDVLVTGKDHRTLLIRQPSWTTETEILINGKRVDFTTEGDYISIPGGVGSGDKILLRMNYQTRVIIPGKENILKSEVAAPVRGTLCYGPFIMAVDNRTGYTFLAEPNDNIVYINTLTIMSEEAGNEGSPYLTAWYSHDGYPSRSRVVFRPVSEMTFDGHPYMMVSLKFVPEKNLK
ncbi:MAG: hypothetical protein A2V64_03265 [Bacteroidetes bacterium RBG_13_43_22]|nr:MAG: hypothetical protein A2V64_03265 [Bacteroidetes bacterium RBG_13_43_22]